MSQAGYTPISLYFSTTAAAVPTSGNLVAGELAINTLDGKLYYKNSAGTVALLASTSGASGDVVGPASSTDNALARFDLATGKLIQNSVGILSDAGILTGLTGITSSGSITLSSLTSGRVTYAGTSGLLQDSANLTFDGTNLTLLGGTANGVAFLNGSKVLTTGSALTFDGTNFATTGTATAAKLIPTGSSATGNGLYLPAANSVGISTNGTNAVYINSSQNVGIGMSSPTIRLQISDVDQSTARIGVNNANGQNYQLVAGNPGASNSGFAIFDATSSATRMYLDSSGNVGIGASSPSSWGKFAVQGTASGSQVVSAIVNTSGTANSQTVLSFDAGASGFNVRDSQIRATNNGSNQTSLEFYTANAATPVERMRIDSSGNVGIGQTSPQAKLQINTAADGAQIIVVSAQTGAEQTLLFRNSFYTNNATAGIAAIGWIDNSFAAGSLTFKTSVNGGGVTNIPVERMRIDSSGNVGIGTTSPQSLLDLTGNDPTIRFTDNAGSPASTFSIRSTDGTLKFRDVTNSSDRLAIDSSGNVLVTSAAGLGYGTGSGGTVTQATSRTTGVTLNKPTGQITMFTAAGSPTPSQFTVTNSLVGLVDTVVLSIASGAANYYSLIVGSVSAGSFNINFFTTGGVTSDTLKINFAIIKGASS